MTGRRSVGAMTFVLLPALMVVGLIGPGTTVSSAPASGSLRTAAASTVPAICLNPAHHGFVPLRADVGGVGRGIVVLAMGRGKGGVPLPPPLTASGKRAFAWDKYGPKPGSAFGNVRFNAHTYPDGSALGNRLLARLKVGNRIILRGSNGVALCYKVAKRIVTTPRHLGGYYSTTAKPKLAIVVCSGTRLGPGNWTKRTIWYALPSTH